MDDKPVFENFSLCVLPLTVNINMSKRVHIYRSTGQRSMFQTSTFCRSTALYINKNWLKYRTKCHQKCSADQRLSTSTVVDLKTIFHLFCSIDQ